MKCAWKELLAVLPSSIQKEVDDMGPGELQEIRMHRSGAVEAVTRQGSRALKNRTDNLSWVINMASKYSPWAQQTLLEGYLTVDGGHRIGVCGECIRGHGQEMGYRTITSLCIRVAKDYTGISQGIQVGGSVLILGPPGFGKTTLLRDLIRRISREDGGYISVVDERGELFPSGGAFDPGPRTDVLSFCPKDRGILQVLKTMGPRYIAVDEITAESDCKALLESARCGVKVIATAHARDPSDLRSRSIYRPIYETGIFDSCIVLGQGQMWRKERIRP